MLRVPNLIRFESQPDFPSKDLTNNNADMFGQYVLANDAAVDAYAKVLLGAQCLLYKYGLDALRLNGIFVSKEDPANNVSFCRGFASFELITTAVRPTKSFAPFAIYNFTGLYLDTETRFIEAELANRVASWQARLPNVVGAIIEAGEQKHESMDQLQTRLMGAQISYELQLQS